MGEPRVYVRLRADVRELAKGAPWFWPDSYADALGASAGKRVEAVWVWYWNDLEPYAYDLLVPRGEPGERELITHVPLEFTSGEMEAVES